MPLLVTIGCPKTKGSIHLAAMMLTNNGAARTLVDKEAHKVIGVFRQMADPDNSKADRLAEALAVDMKQERFKGLWLDNMEGSRRGSPA